MDKNLKPEQPLIDELHRLEQAGVIPERYEAIVSDFLACYRSAVEESGHSFTPLLPLFRLFFKLAAEQFRSPHPFEPYHQKVRRPIDYYRFGIDFILPLVDLPHSKVVGKKHLDRIALQLENGENVVFLSNHQTETDPQAIAILLETDYPQLGEQIIYVAGERVVTDPLAIPFSMGTDLLCIYSKRYIDHPPELKTQKLLHNKQTMARMSHLLQEGGKAIYVAPSGGRDRRDLNGHIEPALFDANSIELFYLMAKKAKTPTHFYPLALSTYDLLPPPETIQKELGETRTAKRTPIHLSFGPECDMDSYPGSDAENKEERRKARALAIWSTVKEMYDNL
jgi:glycerol-3-phosphate O-acyltransferase